MNPSRTIASPALPHADSAQSPEKLYCDAFLDACQAVQLDQNGHYDQAMTTYNRVIEAFSELLKINYTGPEKTDRSRMTQKLNEYVHRAEQLSRFSANIAPTHPDAQKHIPHQDNNTFPVPTLITPFSDDEKTDDPYEKTDADIYLEKAQFSYGQAELNEVNGFLDHALEYYSDAAECFLAAFKNVNDENGAKAVVRDMFTKALDKAEELKLLTKNPSSGKLAVQREKPARRLRSPSFTQREAHTDTPTRRLRSSSVSSARSSPTRSISPEDASFASPTEDIMTQRLSDAEIEVLKYTSNVNNKVFLPWIDESDLKEKFSFTKKFIDPDGSLRLSEKQMANFEAWRRPAEFMKRPKLIQLISSMSIIQYIVTDCSFVASLCVAAAYERKFKKQLITSCIYPQDKQGQPCYNPNGKYVIKLVYNGIARKVVVDDMLPISREKTVMCTFSKNKEELWASIIEKAYMKLMGGYDFPGSNSGIDLYCLTGWIPEHIFIQDKHFVAGNVWDRMLDGATYGDVLVTIATGEMTEAEANELGLVPTHAYAVIDIKTVGDKCFMQVKNPWSHKRWCGPYSHLDTAAWTSDLKTALNYDPDIAEQNDDGIFWIDFNSVCAHFTSIHLNWNPELFTYRWVIHSKWPVEIGPRRDIFNLGYNPQFGLEVNVPDKKPTTVWLLLSKHIMITEENLDYITLHVYNNTSGQRIYYPEEPFKEGTYVNSPHILVRFNAPPGKSTYTVVVSQHEKIRSLYFSLRAYSLAPFKLAEVPRRYPIEKKIPYQWTEQTAGGNISNASFMHNPQWRITIPPPSPYAKANTGLMLMLEAPETFAVHLLLVEGGKRTAGVSTRDILADSGSYRHKFCYCELTNIRPGKYTIVASTFEADLAGQFTLTVASNTEVSIEPIPAEGAGMFQRILSGEWILGYSAMGCPKYGDYDNNPRYFFKIKEQTTLRIRLQANKIDPLPSMNVTIYEKGSNELLGSEIATSGPYTNITQGVTTEDVVLNQNETGYLVVFATHEKGIAGEFRAIVYSDRPVNIQNDRGTP